MKTKNSNYTEHCQILAELFFDRWGFKNYIIRALIILIIEKV